MASKEAILVDEAMTKGTAVYGYEECFEELTKMITKDDFSRPSIKCSNVRDKLGNRDALEHIKKETKTLIHLDGKLQKTKEKNKSTVKLLENANAEIKETKTAISDLYRRIEHLINTRTLKEEKLEIMDRKIRSKHQQLQNGNLKSTQYNNNHLENLGLEISISSDTKYNMSFIVFFHGLLNHDPETSCFCEVALDTSMMKEGEFKIVRSSPNIAIRKLRVIEQCLNVTNDLCGLFVTLKREFSKMANTDHNP